MRRFIRLALLGVLVGIVGIGTALPAQSLNPQVWTWVVDCADNNGVNTTETLGTTLPSGVYAVTVEGACSYGPLNSSADFTVRTPCSVPNVGPVPCTTVTTVNNMPTVACAKATANLMVNDACVTSATVRSDCLLTVNVNGACLVAGTTNLVGHGGGGMHAQFMDSFYGDNTGYYVVTAALTAL